MRRRTRLLVRRREPETLRGLARLPRLADASAAMGIQGTERLSYALGATLMYAGEGKVDQTAQGVRFKGKFDTNLILLVGAAVRYVY